MWSGCKKIVFGVWFGNLFIYCGEFALDIRLQVEVLWEYVERRWLFWVVVGLR